MIKTSYTDGFNAGLDAVVKAMPGEFWTNYEFDPEYRDGYNAYRTALLEKIEELRKV